jgi:hypothetical protein
LVDELSQRIDVNAAQALRLVQVHGSERESLPVSVLTFVVTKILRILCEGDVVRFQKLWDDRGGRIERFVHRPYLAWLEEEHVCAGKPAGVYIFGPEVIQYFKGLAQDNGT